MLGRALPESCRGSAVASALAYAGRGWAVLPLWWPRDSGRCACGRADCGNVGKHPIAQLVPNGLHQASTVADALRVWWSTFPLSNVGVRTGAESGIVVLDVDGPAGREALRRLVERNGPFGAAWTRTGSGGWHAYLAHPGVKVSNSAGRLGPHVDVRGDGGYIVAPPSLHISGGRYRWQVAFPEVLPPLPSWIVQLLTPHSSASTAPVRLSRERLSAYVVAALEREAREVAVAPQGERNVRLNIAAWRLGRLVGARLMGEEAVVDLLIVAATAAGLGEREALATIRSGVRAGARHPRDVTS